METSVGFMVVGGGVGGVIGVVGVIWFGVVDGCLIDLIITAGSERKGACEDEWNALLCAFPLIVLFPDTGQFRCKF